MRSSQACLLRILAAHTKNCSLSKVQNMAGIRIGPESGTNLTIAKWPCAASALSRSGANMAWPIVGSSSTSASLRLCLWQLACQPLPRCARKRACGHARISPTPDDWRTFNKRRGSWSLCVTAGHVGGAQPWLEAAALIEAVDAWIIPATLQ